MSTVALICEYHSHLGNMQSLKYLHLSYRAMLIYMYMYMHIPCMINRIWCLKHHILQVMLDLICTWNSPRCEERELSEKLKEEDMSPVGFEPAP